jgi:hypothetical protein
MLEVNKNKNKVKLKRDIRKDKEERSLEEEIIIEADKNNKKKK